MISDTIEDRFYNIEDLTNGKQALVRRRDDIISTCEIGEIEPQRPGEYPSIRAQDRTGNCDIRILVLYTDAAIARFPTVAQIATTAIAQTKQAFLNSSLATSQVNLVTAGIENLPGYMENDLRMEEVLREIDNVPSLVNTRRIATGADLVVLLVDRNIMASESSLGIAYVGASGPFAGFAVVSAFGAHGNGYAFAHEVGHSLGALHEPCSAEDVGSNCDDSGEYEHAHTWSYKKKCGCGWFNLETRTVHRKTIMYSSGGLNPDVILHYSNPNVKYDGKATGILGERHNSLKISNNACAVSNYLNTENMPLSVNIVGAQYTCEGNIESYLASIGGPPGPYSYAWQVSVPGSGGTAFGPVVGTYSTFDFDFSGFTEQFFVVKVTVTKNNESVTSYNTTEILPPGEGLCARNNDVHNTMKHSVEESGILIFPNPSEGSVRIGFLSKEGAIGRVDIVNQFGQVVLNVHEGVFLTKETIIETTLMGKPNGLYFISITTDGGRKIGRFTLAK